MKLFKEKYAVGIEFETKNYIHRIGIIIWKWWKIGAKKYLSGCRQIRFLCFAYEVVEVNK